MTTMKPRFTVTVTEELLKEIDDFRYENRYPTRTQVANELLRVGLEDIKKKKKDKTQKNSKSHDK